MKKPLRFLLAFIITCIVVEIAAHVLWQYKLNNSVTSELRDRLLIGGLPQAIPQVYLNYTNNPGWRNNNDEIEVNTLGLRDKQQTLFIKQKDTYRILFLGGSTTFGELDDANKGYPALVEAQLNNDAEFKEFGTYKKIECLNAGVGGATTAELVAHYIFKWQYLKPDLIVLHTGVNDAVCGFNFAAYQPDYHHARCIAKSPSKILTRYSFLLHSKALSIILLSIFAPQYSNVTLQSNEFYEFNSERNWFPYNSDSAYTVNYSAYYNNLRALTTQAIANGSKILLVPENIVKDKLPPALPDQDRAILAEQYYKAFDMNNKLIHLLAEEMHLPLCTISHLELRPEMFNDFCHVNEDGEKAKATAISKSILPLIKKQ